MRENWDWEDLKGAPLGGFPDGNRPLPRPPWGRYWWGRIVGALVLFVAITIVFRLETPLARDLQASVRYYLADSGADWTPAVTALARSALWLDSYDRWVFHGLQKQEDAWPVFGKTVGLMLPLEGEVIRPFGWEQSPVDKNKRFHGGIDIEGLPHAPVKAAYHGKVKDVRRDAALGLLVEIDHGGNVIALYANLGEARVVSGQEVRQGDVVGVLPGGPRPYLHFEVRKNGEAVNPDLYLLLKSPPR
ncbi:MAG: hypothetical protein PWP65_842 [Clostridia bacterium]|nr:hypothetical protein [Clostridia bacterium]